MLGLYMNAQNVYHALLQLYHDVSSVIVCLHAEMSRCVHVWTRTELELHPLSTPMAHAHLVQKQ